MHRRAMESEIIILKHHLFFGELHIRQKNVGDAAIGLLPGVLPAVVDSGHELQAHRVFIIESRKKNTVFWIERRDGGESSGKQNVFLKAPPIDVSQLLKKTLFENVETAVFFFFLMIGPPPISSLFPSAPLFH